MRLKFKVYQIYEKQETNNMFCIGKWIMACKIERIYFGGIGYGRLGPPLPKAFGIIFTRTSPNDPSLLKCKEGKYLKAEIKS